MSSLRGHRLPRHAGATYTYEWATDIFVMNAQGRFRLHPGGVPQVRARARAPHGRRPPAAQQLRQGRSQPRDA
eukprot:1955379-Prymnesium_polylepis.1